MKPIKLSILIFVLACVVINTTGCTTANSETDSEPTSKPNTPTPVVSIILIGNHANSQCFDVQLETTIQQIYSSFGNIGIIVVDGTPSLLYDDSTAGILGCYNADYIKKSKKVCKDNHSFWESNYLTPQRNKIINALDECKADDPETDMLQALHIAVESLTTIENSMDTSIEKEIIILDTGICTSGTMNFLNTEYLELLSYNKGKIWEEQTMNSKVFELINHLDNQAEIPDLKGISITWYGLGQVSEPQPALSKLQIQNLQYIWGELLCKAGALPSDKANADEKYGIFLSTSTHGAVESDQPVTPIQWILDDDHEASTEPNLPEQKVYFLANSDEYFSSEEEEAVNSYSIILQNYPNEKILLVGTTSSWNGGSVSLSKRRAEKVKKTMIKHGISESCIIITGLGYNQNYCQNDSPNGQFKEEIGKENRCVFILLNSSPKAQEILSGN